MENLWYATKHFVILQEANGIFSIFKKKRKQYIKCNEYFSFSDAVIDCNILEDEYSKRKKIFTIGWRAIK